MTAASGASEASGVSSGARRSEPVRSVNSSVNSQWPDGSGLSNATATAVLSGLPSTAPLPAAPRTTPQRAVSPAEVRERAGQSRPARNTQAAGATADGAKAGRPEGAAKTADSKRAAAKAADSKGAGVKGAGVKGADVKGTAAKSAAAKGIAAKGAAAQTPGAETGRAPAGASPAGDTSDDSAATQAAAYRLQGSSAQRTAAGRTGQATGAARPGETVGAAPQSAYSSAGYGPMAGYGAGSGAGGYGPNAAGYPGAPQYGAGAPWGAGYAPAAPPPRRSRGLFVTAIVLASVLALALGGLLGHFAPFGDDADSGQAGSTPTASAVMPDGVFVVVSGISGQFTHAGTLSASTTQEFATNVAKGYAESGAAGQEAQFRAYSPTSDRTYRVSCEPRGDGTVLCVGGRNAQIVLWP